MVIDRCYCFGRTFRDLKSAAEKSGVSTVENLAKTVEFGRQCGLCRPYVRRMLRTGETRFRQIVTDEDEPADVGSRP